jgi:hypothetical protein
MTDDQFGTSGKFHELSDSAAPAAESGLRGDLID